jgi:bifunctional UDP-N-acetylglucosamine pyrophosphorylase / glucosamine-1-phosphate N-acetyltransferase
MTITAVILAAGQGTRMRSATPKVLHSLLGHPMASYAIESARQVSGAKPVLVIGHAQDEVRQVLGEAVEYVVQEPQLGTGHAVMQAKSKLEGKSKLVLVTYADMPLISTESLNKLVGAQRSHIGPLTMLTVIAQNPRGFGRVVRDEQGNVKEVVEEAQATPKQLEINELNSGVYCFDADWLWQALDEIQLSSKGEYYLTDLVGIATSHDLSVQALVSEDCDEVIGINTRVHLAEAAAILRKRINESWMLSGVTLIDPASTFIESSVTIGQDTVIWPNTYLQGDTNVGQGCVIGPNTIINNSQVGNHCKVLFSILEKAVVEDNVDIGPFGHLRKGAHLAEGVHMGNFGEVKNSYLGPGTKMGHFSYIGDTTTGTDVNIGAGTITCNFDGKNKNHTDIGAGAFIGSDTMLVAPVEIGAGARTGAGAVVTKRVPPNTLAVGMPARSIKKLEKSD